MNFHIFICILHLLRVYYELTKCAAPNGLIAQLVEHCTGIAEDLDRYLTEFIRSVRRKDGGECEPLRLRSLLASVERHLKKNSYPASEYFPR